MRNAITQFILEIMSTGLFALHLYKNLKPEFEALFLVILFHIHLFKPQNWPCLLVLVLALLYYLVLVL